ncbi:hypothetical protein HED22_13670 [Thalassospira sp. HF15]|uniref:DUF6134 family protein n=1 Tax=Thalassospira sp. HF15 TaxID=2722755 RepID=UPI00143152E0|nr:DUF6134 family protein [Thalassospira sp. HF15]NIY76695.1 hypothetical protein [Thalassospira sp. HF15]
MRYPVKSLFGACALAGYIVLSSNAFADDQQPSMQPSPTPIEEARLSQAFDGPDTCSKFDPIQRYGNELRFQIRRNDAPVGSHVVQFNQGRDGLQVVAQSNIDISFLGFNAYSFDYRSESLWQGDRLAALSVRVDDDGDETEVTAKTNDQGTLVVDGPDGQQTLPNGIFPTDHWHCGVLGSKAVLNTITGKPNAVDIQATDVEMLRTTDGTLPATRFTYDGELETTAWYDADGRWVGLAFEARDGSTITYRCMNCATQTAQKDEE